jgi:alanine dehydrogenase
VLAGGQLFRVTPQVIPAWTGNKFEVVRNREAGKGHAFVKQTFMNPKPTILGPDSEHAALHDEVVIKVSGTYQVAYGRWQESCLCTFTGP